MNGLGALQEVGRNGVVSVREKHPVQGEENILVEGELVPSGGPAHGEGWDGMASPTQGAWLCSSRDDL